MKRLFTSLFFSVLPIIAWGQELQNASPFYIGHSLVNFTMPYIVNELAVDAGKTTSYGQQIINGATLWSNHDNYSSAQGTPYVNAFPEGEHDVLIVTEAVPLLNHLQWSYTYRYADSLFRYALNNNNDLPLRYFIYETWHCINTGISGCDYDQNDNTLWHPRLIDDLPLWTGIVDSVRLKFPDEQVYMVPAGQAFYHLVSEIDEGNLPGIESFRDLFSDDIHLTTSGNYFVACVMYACIFRSSPEGLTHQIYDEWGNLLTNLPTREQAEVMQRVAWETVTQMSDYSGVSEVACEPVSREVFLTICAGEEVFLEGEYRSEAGIYADIYTSAAGCDSIVSTELTINPLPFVNAGDDVEVCMGEEVLLAAEGEEGFEWSNGVLNGEAFIPESTAYYTVISTGTNGCIGVDSVLVTVHELPEVSAGNNLQVCEGEEVTLAGSGAEYYQWEPDVQNGTPFIPVGTTSYTVLGLDENGCSNTDEVEVVVNPVPNVELVISAEVAILCTHDASFLITGGSPSGGVYGGIGISEDMFNPSAAGEGSHIISYTYTEENNCSATAEQEVHVEVCTSVDSPNDIAFNVYPNPSNGEVQIQSVKPITIKIFDNRGNLVQFSENVNDLRLDLPNGLYLIYGYHGNTKSVKKLLVN